MSGDCSPFDPSAALRVINEGFALSSFSGFSTGPDWKIQLSGKAGRRTLDEVLTRDKMATNDNVFKSQPGGTPFVVHDSAGIQWWGAKRTSSANDFALIWIVIHSVK